MNFIHWWLVPGSSQIFDLIMIGLYKTAEQDEGEQSHKSIDTIILIIYVHNDLPNYQINCS